MWRQFRGKISEINLSSDTIFEDKQKRAMDLQGHAFQKAYNGQNSQFKFV